MRTPSEDHALLAIHELEGLTANWSGPLRWKRHFRLEHDGHLLATLDWHTASGSLALARWTDGAALLECGHPSSGHVSARSGPEGREMAQYTARAAGGGRLFVHQGGTWTWRAEGMSLAHWALRDERGEVALRIKVLSMRFTPAGSVTISDSAREIRELPLLVTLGWYLVVRTIDDGAWLASALTAG
jgi:hypothetical protein